MLCSVFGGMTPIASQILEGQIYLFGVAGGVAFVFPVGLGAPVVGGGKALAGCGPAT